MTTPTPCQSRCSLHSKRDTHLPCKACISKHLPLARAAAVRTAGALAPSEDNRPHREAREDAPLSPNHE